MVRQQGRMLVCMPPIPTPKSIRVIAHTTRAGSNSPKPPTTSIYRDTKSNSQADATQPIFSEHHASTIEQRAFIGQATFVQKPVYYNQSTATETIDLDGMVVVKDTDKSEIPDANEDIDRSLRLQLPTGSAQQQQLPFDVERSTAFKTILQEVLLPLVPFRRIHAL